MLQYRASTVQRVQMQIEDARFDEYAKEVIDEYRTAVFPLHAPLPQFAAGTGLTPATSAPGLGPPLPTSALGLGPPFHR